MDCSYFRERINLYIDGELGYLEVAELQQHLSFCPRLRRGARPGGRGARRAGRVGPARAGHAARLRGARDGGGGARAGARLAAKPFGRAVNDTLQKLDDTLGRIPLPGGRTIPVKNVIGWGLAAAAVAVGLGRRHGRRSRELKPL